MKNITPPSETQVTCPSCGQSGFIKLSAHRCKAKPISPPPDAPAAKADKPESDEPLGAVVFHSGSADGWDAAKQYVDASKKFTVAALACQVMAGFELIELHKEHGIYSGKRTDLGTSADGQPRLPAEGKSWGEIVQEKVGLAERTANTWMKIAERAAPLLANLEGADRLKAILAAGPAAWNPDDSALMFQSVRQVTDGKTQLDLLNQLGAMAPQKPGGDAVWEKFIKQKHPNLITVDGDRQVFPNRKDVTPEIRAQFEKWREKELVKAMTPEQRVDHANEIVTENTKTISIFTRQKEYRIADPKTIDQQLDAAKALVKFLEKLKAADSKK